MYFYIDRNSNKRYAAKTFIQFKCYISELVGHLRSRIQTIDNKFRLLFRNEWPSS